MRERILAEAELQEGAYYRLVKDGVGDYAVQKVEAQKILTNARPNFWRALQVFMDCVVDAEVERRD